MRNKKARKPSEPFNIPAFHESVRIEYEAGLLTLHEVAIEFCKANWTPYVDIEYTKKWLGL
ncbi:Uncharacterised protein [Yersinia enterocolitica]|uniref:hypothetical protein n=1 Tax=Enterobacterales TaxID=91347 RepID=UPI0005E94BD6|nr:MULTISPECIES: hypothetical protein [Enterobacterales]MBU5964326.1 hypothetical protein [Proteus mirabilis]CQQ96446.1 Uncharacterised protein [Yersinia enterocolitica]